MLDLHSQWILKDCYELDLWKINETNTYISALEISAFQLNQIVPHIISCWVPGTLHFISFQKQTQFNLTVMQLLPIPIRTLQPPTKCCEIEATLMHEQCGAVSILVSISWIAVCQFEPFIYELEIMLHLKWCKTKYRFI